MVDSRALAALQTRIAPLFPGEAARRQALGYLEGLLGPLERKTGARIAEYVGDPPDRMQRLLASYRWDPDPLRDDLRAYVVEHLGDPRAVLVVDETGFAKRGGKSAGVQRQFSDAAHRVENCQVGVFLAYAGRRGSALIDRELYLPRAWAGDPERRREAGVPDDVEFATKPRLAQRMLARAFDAGVPAAWVVADAIYGNDRHLRAWLDERGVAYVLGVRSNEPLPEPARDIATGPPAEGWERHGGAEWARWPLSRSGSWLLVRRGDGEHYHVASGHASLAELARVARLGSTVEACVDAAREDVGLDEYAVRRWPGWYRHVTLALLAHALLAVNPA